MRYVSSFLSWVAILSHFWDSLRTCTTCRGVPRAGDNKVQTDLGKAEVTGAIVGLSFLFF